MIAVVTDHCCHLVIKCKRAAVQKVLDTVCLSDVTDVESQLTQAALLRDTVEKRMLYGDIGRIAMGKWGVLLVNIALLATQYGFCVGYFIFMGNTIALMFTVPVTPLHNGSASNVTSPPSHSHHPPPFALIVLIPLLPLILFSYIRGVRRLGPISFMANIALFVAFLSVIGYMLSGKCCSLLSLLRLSSCNYSFLFGILQYQLQQVLNAAAHIACLVQRYSHMTRMLRRLHWLPVKYCIIIKIILLVLKVYHNMAPSYLRDLLEPKLKGFYCLKNQDQFLLAVPKTKCKTLDDRAFYKTGATLWSS